MVDDNEDFSETPLTFCTTPELIQELGNRYEAFVMAALPKGRATEATAQIHTYGGDVECSGLTNELHAFNIAITNKSWEEALEDDDDD